MSTINERVGFGVLEGVGTYYNNASLGTTADKVTLAAETSAYPLVAIKVVITNGSTTQVIAWARVAKGAAAPTMTATYDTNTKQVALPGTAHILAISPDEDLWVVADGAGAKVNVGSYPYA